MKRINFSPVVMIILGAVPFLLMIAQWITEDIIGFDRVINSMTRWEVMLQIGIEMIILGLLLWGIDWLKEFNRIRKWHLEFIKEWQSNYKELDEEEAREEHFPRELVQLNKEFL